MPRGIDPITARYVLEFIRTYGGGAYVPSTAAITAGVGLTGGGLLTSSPTINLDISTLTADTDIGAADLIPIHDGAMKYITRSNFEADLALIQSQITVDANIDLLGFSIVDSTGDLQLVPSTGTVDVHDNVFLHSNNVAPATLSLIRFIGKDDGANDHIYGQITGVARTITDGAEEGYIRISASIGFAGIASIAEFGVDGSGRIGVFPTTGSRYLGTVDDPWGQTYSDRFYSSDGTSASPAFQFSSEASGIYLDAANTLGWSLIGETRMRLGLGGSSETQFLIESQNQNAPALYFQAEDSGGSRTNYVRLNPSVVDSTHTNETSRYRIDLADAGSFLQTRFNLTNTSLGLGGSSSAFALNLKSVSTTEGGQIGFFADDDGAGETEFGRITSVVDDGSAAAEDGILEFDVIANGSLVTPLQVFGRPYGQGTEGHVRINSEGDFTLGKAEHAFQVGKIGVNEVFVAIDTNEINCAEYFEETGTFGMSNTQITQAGNTFANYNPGGIVIIRGGTNDGKVARVESKVTGTMSITTFGAAWSSVTEAVTIQAGNQQTMYFQDWGGAFVFHDFATDVGDMFTFSHYNGGIGGVSGNHTMTVSSTDTAGAGAEDAIEFSVKPFGGAYQDEFGYNFDNEYWYFNTEDVRINSSEKIITEYRTVTVGERSAALAVGNRFAMGNGGSPQGFVVNVPTGWECHAVAMSLLVGGGTATVDLRVNSVNQGVGYQTIVSSGTTDSTTFGTPLAISDGDTVGMQVTAVGGTPAGPNTCAVWLRFRKT